MAAEIKQYKGRYTGPQIDDLLGRVPKLETRVTVIENNGSTGNNHYKEVNFESPHPSWTCEHNLGRRPAVTILDMDGYELIADIYHISNDKLVVYFGKNQAGKLILN